jgi:hypothetical protein
MNDPKPTRLEPTQQCPFPTPASGGNWRRDADGGLSPADQGTAESAGLAWPALAPAASPAPSKLKE